MTTSLITAALPGTASSTSRGQSCPSAYAIGHIGPDQRDLVLPLQSEPQNEPERIDPRSSSPGPCRFTTEVTCPDFYSGATGRSGRFGEGFLLRRLHPAE